MYVHPWVDNRLRAVHASQGLKSVHGISKRKEKQTKIRIQTRKELEIGLGCQSVWFVRGKGERGGGWLIGGLGIGGLRERERER